MPSVGKFFVPAICSTVNSNFCNCSLNRSIFPFVDFPKIHFSDSWSVCIAKQVPFRSYFNSNTAYTVSSHSRSFMSKFRSVDVSVLQEYLIVCNSSFSCFCTTKALIWSAFASFSNTYGRFGFASQFWWWRKYFLQCVEKFHLVVIWGSKFVRFCLSGYYAQGWSNGRKIFEKYCVYDSYPEGGSEFGFFSSVILYTAFIVFIATWSSPCLTSCPRYAILSSNNNYFLSFSVIPSCFSNLNICSMCSRRSSTEFESIVVSSRYIIAYFRLTVAWIMFITRSNVTDTFFIQTSFWSTEIVRDKHK